MKEKENWIEVKEENSYLEKAILVKCVAEIKNNETGEVREYETNQVLKLESEYPEIFNWQEGNYSCDCNRRLFFSYAIDEEVEFEGDCSEGKFSVNLKNKKDSKVYYREFN